MSTLVVHALHGTFQRPDVWSGLAERLSAHIPETIRVVSEALDPPPAGGLDAWARSFCARTAAATAPGDAGSRRILLGYSLGGRLAMHALLARPDLWGAAILVAAHPGDTDPASRAAVRERDAAWAARCRSGEAWDRLLEAWDALPVFGGHPNRAPRAVAQLDRERCARVFEAFSRAGQADLRDALAAADLPAVLYVTGADDPSYPALGAELAARVPAMRHETISGAGHRVPWDRPEPFAERVGRFLTDPAIRRDDGGHHP